ncbi:hypothetical protein MITS9509_00692 [Synechococcus sp. MIT S9509]|nr:hypothetical protein MITS9504_00315 [Synechococcus sp. MIT S9504]KZR93397.1 hypothetical protein MITS9509_00692 [Synechococcus sp. MIT S9509]
MIYQEDGFSDKYLDPFNRNLMLIRSITFAIRPKTFRMSL